MSLIPFDPARLFVQLQNTGLAVSNNPQYQLLRTIIGLLDEINKLAGTGNATASGDGLDDAAVAARILLDIEGGGSSSSSGTGPVGPTGPQGPAGATGATGPQGIPGPLNLDIPDEPDINFGILSGGSSSPSGLIQSIQASTSTKSTTSSGTYADVTNLTTSIIPTKISSRIRVQVSISCYLNYAGAGSNPQLGLRIVRDSTTIKTWNLVGITSGSILVFQGYLDYIDSPASLASLTYKIQFAMVTGGAGSEVQINHDNAGVNGDSSITLTEII